MLYLVTLNKIAEVKLFKWIFRQVKPVQISSLLSQSDRKPGFCHRMAPLQMFYIMTLTYSFKVTNFEMWISRYITDLANGYWWSQNSNGSSIRCLKNNTVYIFPQKSCFLFHLFEVERKILIVSFLANWRINSRFVYGLWSRCSGSINKCTAWKNVAMQLSLHFPDGNV